MAEGLTSADLQHAIDCLKANDYGVPAPNMADLYLRRWQQFLDLPRLLPARVEDLIAKNKEREELAMPLGDQLQNIQVNYPPSYTGMEIRETLVYPVKIEKLLSGYLVRVGCKQAAFETIETMLHEIRRYLKNPVAIEKEYLEKA